jgi:HEAT repeat protein
MAARNSKTMKRSPFNRELQGGDRRSIGNSNRVVAAILKNPRRLPDLIECLLSGDPIVRMRAADAAEKISVKKPELFQPFKVELLGLANETIQAELRWHLAMMLPRLPLTAAERERARSTLQRYLTDRSSIVKTFALQGMAELAEDDTSSEAEMIDLLEKACRTGTPAMKARSRKLLKQFQKP